MNRLDNRIEECRHMCCYNVQMMPELFGLMDAKEGSGRHMPDVSPSEWKDYLRGLADGRTLKLLDEKESKDGHDLTESHPSLCTQANRC